MSGYVCTVAGGKGGVGKTTTAINIAAVLESEGHDTVVIDADLGMANLGEMVGVEPDVSIHEILAGDASVSEGLSDAQGGITAIAGEQTLEAFAEADPAKLRKVIKTLRNTYDVVLVDTGAGLSHETTVPLGLADGVLLVTTPDDVAVSDTVKTAELTTRVDGNVLGVLVTRVTRDTDLTAIADQFDCPLLGVTPIDMDAAGNEPLVLNFADSNASDAYKQLTGGLSSVFFGDATGEAIDRVFEKDWFVEQEKEEEEAEEPEEEESEGVFGGLFG